MKILLSSQDFGYWPTTQMFSFIKHLLIHWFAWEIFIKNNSSSKIFYDNFIKDNNWINIYLVDNYSWNYDKYIWFYDPEIIFEWKRKWKKTIFLCNLTFLWNDELIKKYENWVDFNNLNFQNISNYHEIILLWYLIADKIFIRKTDWINKEWLLYKLIKEKLSLIWPIIYPKIYKRNKKDFILIQFWWQVNPISSIDFYEVYFKLIKNILSEINIEKIIIVNPLLKDITKKIFTKDKIITTLSQEKYQKLLSETQALFSPFWINTFFESSYYDIPNYILPEQHLWHIKSIIKYFWNTKKIESQSLLLYNLEKYNLNYENEIDFIKILQNKYENLLEFNITINTDFSYEKWKNLINLLNLNKDINSGIDIFINEVIMMH
jgi:hypothetical protein